ncbi:kinase-like domain-containing protein, partial [Mycena olivaceomarginata]
LLDHVSSPSVISSIFSALWRLSRAYGLYPTCFALTGVKLIRQFSITGRGFGDIYKAVLAGQLVSVKRLRMFEYSRVPAKGFGHEALIWRQLCHPNLVPFLGLCYLEGMLCLVAPWMENGNIVRYLAKKSPNIDHRLSLIVDGALGVEFLHR